MNFAEEDGNEREKREGKLEKTEKDGQMDRDLD